MTIKTHLSCDACGSSDALTDYGDHTYCFSCKDYVKKGVDKEEEMVYSNLRGGEGWHPRYHLSNTPSTTFYTPSTYNNNNYKGTFTVQYKGLRGISENTMRFYGVKCRVKEDGTPFELVYPYDGFDKIRDLLKKGFRVEGDGKKAGVWGKEKFSPSSSKSITITEGEDDAMAVFEMMGKYAAVSVRSSVFARRDCEADFKYLDSFERIYLCFDDDEPGQKALKEVASLFDPNKVYHVQMGGGMKDARDYLMNSRSDEFRKIWWNSKMYLPKGIVASYQDIEKILETEGEEIIANFPFETLNEMTYGLRSGKVYLFTAKEKIGKTSVMKAIEHHLLKTTDYNIGVIHLEEGEKKTVKGLVTYELEHPVELPDSGITNAEIMAAYKDMTKRDGRLHFYTHFGSDDPDTIINAIRYMVAVCKCKFVVLDHITMLVTGFETDDERKKLDYISTRLAMLTRELDFTLLLVSHVNADGDTRGSKNISKVADLIVYIDRDIESSNYDARHTTSLLVKGNRDVAKSGPAGHLWFDERTYCLKEKTIEQEAEESPF